MMRSSKPHPKNRERKNHMHAIALQRFTVAAALFAAALTAAQAAEFAVKDEAGKHLDVLQDAVVHGGYYTAEAETRAVLHGLGFKREQQDKRLSELSGGWKMRVAMARVLLSNPDVLLMDEPTNHLDIESIIWLEQFLRTLPSALLMTSHDREFMNRIVTKIAEIDSGEITVYSGNYDFYERERAIREANREAAYARQQAMLAKEQRFIERFAAHAAKAAQVTSTTATADAHADQTIHNKTA